VIPDLDPSTGHLPLGRYRATLTEVYDRFVDHPDFADSPTRHTIWDSFIAYMTAWRTMEDQLAAELGGQRLVMAVWLAGSFISLKLDPHNIDLTVLLDGELAEACQGKPGIGAIRRLSYRDGMLETFKVSPCVVMHRYFRSPFRPQLAGHQEVEDYVMMRGAFDDWWQRTRPEGEPKDAPTRQTAAARRGYLEVEG
jgi:hypothetical protein